MSAYALQKLIRQINRDPDVRREFIGGPQSVAARFELTAAETAALVDKDYGVLYALGVHGLLLRPFSILFRVAEAEYLAAIRATQ